MATAASAVSVAPTAAPTSPTTAPTIADTSTKESAQGQLRAELVGHVSVLLMSLLGVAMYSATYSITMAVGVSSKKVPVLEFWVVFTALTCNVVCVCMQFIAAGVFKVQGGLPGVPEAQVAVFLGLACACTVLSSQCVSGDTTTCLMFFPSAVFPNASAVGIMVWTWIIYLASLGCLRASVGALSLGIEGTGGVVAACVMLLLPATTASAMATTCGQHALPKDVCVGLGDDCGSVLVSSMVWLSLGVVVVAGGLRKWQPLELFGLCLQGLVAALLLMVTMLVVPGSVASIVYRLTAFMLCMCTFIEAVIGIVVLLSSTSSTSTSTTSTTSNNIITALSPALKAAVGGKNVAGKMA